MAVAYIMLVIAVGLQSTFAGELECHRAIEEGSCDFYKHCVEDQIPCGVGHYALSYGLKYCHAFTHAYSSFNDVGKAFVNGTRECLIRSLNAALNQTTSTTNSCERVKQLAYDTHMTCYLENGFCDVMAENKAALYRVYDVYNDFLFTPDWHLVWTQTASTMVECRKLSHWRFTLSDTISILRQFFGTWLEPTVAAARGALGHFYRECIVSIVVLTFVRSYRKSHSKSGQYRWTVKVAY